MREEVKGEKDQERRVTRFKQDRTTKGEKRNKEGMERVKRKRMRVQLQEKSARTRKKMNKDGREKR